MKRFIWERFSKRWHILISDRHVYGGYRTSFCGSYFPSNAEISEHPDEQQVCDKCAVKAAEQALR